MNEAIKSALKLGLIGAGAYLVWRQVQQTTETFLQHPTETALPEQEALPYPIETPPATAPPSTTPPTTAPPATAPPAAAPPAAQLSLIDLMKVASGVNARGFDEWNWYFKEITGRPGPAPEDVQIARVDPMPLMTAEAWAAALMTGGFQL